MAFSFHGILSSGQWDEFLAFTNIQRVDLAARKQWLSAQLSRNGIFITTYDDTTNLPVSFSCTPGSSYGAKLFSAYRALGGNPEADMLLRTRDQPVFLTQGNNTEISTDGSDPSTLNTGFSDIYTNGRRNRGGMRFDRDLGMFVNRVKSWQLEAIKRKREHLEFKIKRALDYSDQLQQEIDQIDTLLGDGPGSLDSIISDVEVNMLSANRLNVVDDPDDTRGLNIGREGDLTIDDGLQEADTNKERIP